MAAWPSAGDKGTEFIEKAASNQYKPNSKSCAVPSGLQAGLESFALSFSDKIMCLPMWIEHSVMLMLQAPISS